MLDKIFNTMSLIDALNPIFITIAVIIVAFIIRFQVNRLIELYTKRDNEIRKYGIQNLEHRFYIDAMNVETTKQKIMNWIGSLQTIKIEEQTPTHLRAHVNKWEFADNSVFYGWQKMIDVWLQQKCDGVEVTVTMTPSDGYRISLIGEDMVIGWEKMTKQLMKSLAPDNSSIITDVNNGRNLKNMLNNYKLSYQRSLILLVLFYGMIFFPAFAGHGMIQGAINGVGIIGLIILIAKFCEEYQVYWDTHVKIEKELGVQWD